MKKRLFIIIPIAIVFLGMAATIIHMHISRANEVYYFSFDGYEDYVEQYPSDKTYGEISDAKTAKEVAEKLWIEIYGKETMKNEKPYRVLYDYNTGVWFVYGTLPSNYVGGTAHALIRNDGRVLAVWHEK